MKARHHILAVVALFCGSALASPPIRLVPGFVYKIRCEGRLLVSAVGNPTLIQMEALPKEVGCGALVQPLGPAGVTDLLLETSIGTVRRLVEVSSSAPKPSQADLEIAVRPEEQ